MKSKRRRKKTPIPDSAPAVDLIQDPIANLAHGGGEGQLQYLSHELQVHQEELEIQNRQLIESRRLLEESRDRYANLYDFAPIAHVTLCGHGVIREINLTGADLLGLPRNRLLGKPLIMFVAPVYRRLFMAHLSRCRSGGANLITELALSRRDGAEVWVELRTNSVPLEHSSGPVYLSVLVDITERRRIDLERERMRGAVRSEQLLRTIIETLPVAVRVVGAGGESLLFNEACRSVWGISPGTALPRWDLQTGWDPGSRRRLTSGEWPVAIALHKAQPSLRKMIHIQGFDARVRVVIQSAAPMLDAGGLVNGVVEVTEDITPLMMAQEAARQRQEQLEAAFDAAHLSFWDWNLLNNRLTWSGPLQQYFTPPQGETSGKTGDFVRRLHPDAVSVVRAAVLQARRGRMTLEMEFRIVLDDGRERWLLAKGRFAYNDAGKAMRMSGVVLDVTARKIAELETVRAKEAAEQASRLKDDFLATVSHELRTPLSAMLLWAHLARTSQESPRQLAEALDAVLQNAKAQSQIVDDLLDISRGIAGKLRLNFVSSPLHEPVKAALEAVRPAALGKNIQLGTRFAHNLPLMQIDPDRMRQVVWNLLSNAIKFTPPGGSVTVTVERARGGSGPLAEKPVARLSVRDTGQGIIPEFLPHVFDRFRQADAGCTRTQGGLGLGLAIARELAQMHGGTISAESRGPGRGATFIVDLPLPAAGVRAGAPAEAPVNGKELSLHGLSVLLVEDDPDTRMALDRILETAGALVRPAASVSAALEQFQAARPDVLVSDIAMPEQDGYALMRRVRELEAQGMLEFGAETDSASNAPDAADGTRKMPALALTALARPEDQARAMAAGFQAHLAKPVSPERLISTVAALYGAGNRRHAAGKNGSPEAARKVSRARRIR